MDWNVLRSCVNSRELFVQIAFHVFVYSGDVQSFLLRCGMNGAPNKNRPHSWRFTTLACKPLNNAMCFQFIYSIFIEVWWTSKSWSIFQWRITKTNHWNKCWTYWSVKQHWPLTPGMCLSVSVLIVLFFNSHNCTCRIYTICSSSLAAQDNRLNIDENVFILELNMTDKTTF